MFVNASPKQNIQGKQMNAEPNSELKKNKLSELDIAKAMARLEGKLRKTNARDFMANSVMSDHQWSLFIKLRRELATHGLEILVGVPLTAIIDTERHKIPDALWRSSVLFAVVTIAPHGAVRLLVLDTIEEAIERCLDQLRIRHITYNALLSDEDFAKVILDEIEFQFQLSAATKSLINRSENDVAKSLRNGVLIIEHERLLVDEPADRETYQLYNSIKLLQEVALHRICASRLIGGLLTSDEERIRSTSSVDILVHSSPPLNLPLLAVEFDGPYHEHPDQQRKDRFKDAVLSRYGIPLIRISRLDAAFGNLTKDGKSESHRRYVRGLTELVSSIVCHMHFETDSTISSDKARKALDKLEDDLATSIFGKAYLELNDEQRLRIDESTFCSKEEDEYRFQNLLYNRERDQAIDRAREEIEWPDELTQYSLCPEIHGDLQTGFWAAFKVNTPNGKRLEVTLPKIWVQAKDLDKELLTARITADLIQIAADLVRQLIRMNTPAVRR